MKHKLQVAGLVVVWTAYHCVMLPPLRYLESKALRLTYFLDRKLRGWE